MALALAVVLGIGGVVAISLSGPLEDTSSQADPSLAGGDEDSPADAAGSQAAGGDARAGGVLEENDTDGDVGAEAGTNATNSSRVRANATNLTLEGPANVSVDTPESYHGRLSAAEQGIPHQSIELRVDGHHAATAQTNESGHYQTMLAIAEAGNHTLQAFAWNASSALEEQSSPLNVTAQAPQPPRPVFEGGGWPMFRADPARTGARGTAGPGDGSLLWALETDLDVRGSPAVAADTVYVGTSGVADCCRPTLFAVNASTGEPIWEVTREHGFGSPVVQGDTLLVGAGPDLLAYDAGNGTQLWSRSVDFTTVAPALDNNTVYTVDDPGQESTAVRARDIETGEQRWSRELSGEPEADPAIASGVLYVGLGSTLHALETATGATEWTFEADETLFAPPAIANGTVYTGSIAGSIYAVNADSGEQVWRNTIHGTPGGLAVGGERVHVGSTAGWLYAFDVASGDYRLNESLASGALAGPALTDDTLYLALRGGDVVALDAASGAEHWSFPVAGHEHERISSSPAVVDGRLFVGIDDNCTGCADTGLVALDAGEAKAD